MAAPHTTAEAEAEFRGLLLEALKDPDVSRRLFNIVMDGQLGFGPDPLKEGTGQ